MRNFIGAPRLHNGLDLAANEFPAVLEKGEKVVSRAEARRQDNSKEPEVKLRLVNVVDPAIVGDYLSTEAGERLIVNVIEKNQRRMRG